LKHLPCASRLLSVALLLAATLGCVPVVRAAEADGATHPAASLVERSAREMRRDPEISRREAERALEVLARQPDADLEVRTRLLLCDYWSERDGAQAEAQRAAVADLLPIVRRTGFKAGELTCAGLIAEARADNPVAHSLYDQAVRAAEERGDNEMLGDALFARGYLSGVQGDFANGLTDLRRAQALYDRLGLTTHSLTTLNSIAIIYNRMGDTAQAQSIYQRALQAQHAAGLRREEAVTNYNLGRAAETLRQWNHARAAFEASIAVSREISYRRAEMYSLRGLAAVAVGENNPDRALALVREARSLAQHITDERLTAQLALVEGMALRQQKKLTESRAAFEGARTVMEKGDAQAELVTLYDQLAVTDAALGDWRSAYQSRTRAREVNERLLRNQIDQRFAMLKVEFDTATKDKENAALLKANAAGELALTQTRRARALQGVVIALAAVLAAVLAALAWHQRRSSVRMHALALTDELTEAPNRRAVLGRLQQMLGEDQERRACLLLLDIDHFKSINDRYGHATGDKVLRAVALRLRASLQESDFNGRIGGEEFLVVAPDESLESAVARAEVLRFQITAIDTSAWFGDAHSLTVSIGVAERQPGDTLTTFLQRVDAALYVAKRDGRNCVRSLRGTTGGRGAPSTVAS
jgi:diguanylate cyclase (GGDEF)-like protein